MKRSTVILALLVLSALAPAQWLDRSILLTNDTFPFLGDSRMVYVNPVSGRLYITHEGYQTHIYDCNTRSKFGIVSNIKTTMEYLPSTGRLFGGSSDGSVIYTFDAVADTQTLPIFRTQDGIWSLAIDRVQEKLYASNGNGQVLVFDARTGALLNDSLWMHREYTHLAWDSASNRLFCGGSGQVAAIDCAADTVLGTITGAWTADLVLHPSRPEVIAASGYRVRFASTESLVIVDSVILPFHIEDRALVVDRRSNRLYVLNIWQPQRTFSPSVAIIDLATDSLLRVVDLAGHVTFVDAVVAESPQGSKLYLRDGENDSLIVLSPDGNVVGGLQLGFNGLWYSGCAWHPRFNRLYVASCETLFVVDCLADTLVDVVPYSRPSAAQWLYWLPGPDRLYLGIDNGVGWLGPGDTLAHWLGGIPGNLVAADADAGRLYLLGGDRFSVYDCNADTLATTLPFTGAVQSSLYLPDHEKLYLLQGATVHVYDTRNGSFLPPIAACSGTLTRNPATGLVYAASTGVCEIDPAQGSVTRRLEQIPGRPVVVPANDELWLINDEHFKVIALDSLRYVRAYSLPRMQRALAMDTRRGKLYSICGYDDRINVVDCSTHSVIRRIDPRLDLWYATLFIDSLRGKLYVSDTAQVVIDLDTDSVIARVPVRGRLDTEDVSDGLLYVAQGYWLHVLRDTTSPGVAERGAPAASRPTPAATLIRGVLSLPTSLAPYPSSLLDASGRRVLSLKPGRNDVSRLAPGVYFVRQKRSSGQVAQWSSEKVVITK